MLQVYTDLGTYCWGGFHLPGYFSFGTAPYSPSSWWWWSPYLLSSPAPGHGRSTRRCCSWRTPWASSLYQHQRLLLDTRSDNNHKLRPWIGKALRIKQDRKFYWSRSFSILTWGHIAGELSTCPDIWVWAPRRTGPPPPEDRDHRRQAGRQLGRTPPQSGMAAISTNNFN